MKTIKDLPKEVLNYLWKWEYNQKWADENKYKNIEEELNNLGWTLVDKTCIGDYGDLRGYLNFEIEELSQDEK